MFKTHTIQRMKAISHLFRKKGLVFLLIASLYLFNGTDSIAEQTGQLVSEPIFNSKVYIEEYGNPSAMTLVLVHGTGYLGGKIWTSLIDDLKNSFHILSFDLPGFGRSEKQPALYSPANYARFLKWLLDAYTKKPVFLVGHSMGGAIALYYAGTYPQTIERLILIDAAGILHRAAFTKNILDDQISGELKVGNTNVIEKPMSILKYLVNTAIENVDNRLVPENLGPLLDSETFRKTVLNGNPIKISGLAMIQTNFSPILGKVTVPTVIIWGENDTIAPFRTAKVLAGNIKQSSLIVLTGLKHNPMLEDPQTFNRILLKSVIEPVINPYPKITDRRNIPLELPDREIGNQNKIQISGNYGQLKIKNSKGFVITDTTARHIEIEDSEVELVNSSIQGKEIALIIKNSIVIMTGVSVSGDTAIRVYNSNLDIAGSQLQAKKHLIESQQNSTIVFSVTKIDSPERKGFAHEVIHLYMGETY